ncbi:hypothetical protein SEA_ASEGATO_17 [Microbacterium phage ASegato]|nr:hypothetical protein SEA_ERENYEAGER_17 [Microbacterium phage Erenyeager]WNO25913.1 hypothetical protein SEA_ASEGATO_17 [Microbacterium phage ASegato]
MSSAMKDARWQLAEDMADSDGVKFLDLKYGVKERYLYSAQLWLERYGTSESIDALAARFRKEPDRD